MTIIACSVNGEPAFKWNDGPAYVYKQGNSVSREAARQRAMIAGKMHEGIAQHFTATLQAMSDDDALAIVDRSLLQEIKRNDPTPKVNVYVIGHEGEAKGPELGRGQRIWRYMRDAIEKMHNAVRMRTPVFVQHMQGSNTHAGRNAVGEIIGKSLRNLGDMLQTLVAVYIKPEYKQSVYDVASIEATVQYSLDNDGVANVREFREISGLAIGNSSFDTPGFPGAKLEAALQAFRDYRESGGGNNMPNVTLDELRQAIKTGNYSPSDLFDDATLTNDPKVISHVRTQTKTEYEHAKDVEKRLGEKLDTMREQLKAAETKAAELEAKALSSTHAVIVDKLIGGRKLNEKATEWVKDSLGNFKASDNAKDQNTLESEMTKFIDDSLKRFEKYVGKSTTDSKTEDNKGGTQSTGNDIPTPPPNPSHVSNDGKDLTQKENNPLIPK